MDVETFKALGLDRPFDPGRSHGVGSYEDFLRFLQPPEDAQYRPCSEAASAPGIPRGRVRRYQRWSSSDVYAGTQRDLWLYTSP